VFVSSTLQELAPERAAACAAIEGLRFSPVLFELGARPHPPRALCRAYLEQSHVFVGIYWERYGWVAPGMEISGRVLLRKLPVSRDELPREIQEAIDIESYRIQKTREGKIDLERGIQALEPRGAKETFELPIEDLEPLSQIIQELNDRFGVGLTEEDRLSIERLLERLADEPALEASVRVNTPENARLTFDHVVNDRLQDMIESNFKLYKQIADDPEFGGRLLDRLFEVYLDAKKVES
jgi:hypothetical protein